MASLSAFTFVATIFIMGLTSLVYLFVTPLFNIFMAYGVSLSPSMTGVFGVMQLFWTYLMLPVTISIILYFIANSQDMDGY